ncbi:Inosine-5'-monophosphate dehydrogenase [wastewater metagenome]|uniref:Inosine-5'-monophosphate dehydrogenase n=2 Tax=unclassified sequences TaxID=12908 RepID=A0A5B8R969_9ZZZZ|nr:MULTISPECIES: CBS domain-containing protein [Arhodomonas]MCS4503157.1 CBS domain-containing protein [Arhodomonas aquaeolei]QEA04523.1 inosine-5'-monophosphate dehydrogenase [uncultured organism]
MRQPVRRILDRKSSQMYVLGPDASVADAVQMMNRHNIGAVLVVDPEQALLGIFTERDVLRRVIDGRLDYDRTPIEQVMTRKVFYIEPDTSVEEALTMVNERACRHLPVMEGGQLLGMISIRDLTAAVMADRDTEIQHLTGYIAGSY